MMIAVLLLLLVMQCGVLLLQSMISPVLLRLYSKLLSIPAFGS